MPRPSDTLSFVLAQTCKLHRQRAETYLSRHGLYIGQDKILFHLWREDGLTQSELAERLVVQAATVTKMVHRMVKAGLIRRSKDLDDQRVSRVYLTDAGLALREAVDQVWVQLDSDIGTSLSLEERVLLRRLLLQVQENLRESV